MKEQIEKTIVAMATAHGDRRLEFFNVAVESCDAATVKLSGKVLETAHLQALLHQMPPGVKVDASAVNVLRKDSKTIRYVATNLTDLRREPSWISELMTQFTPGTPLEVLEENERWTFVRMTDGYLGWAYKPFLTDRQPDAPTHMVTVPVAGVFDRESKVKTRLLAGTLINGTDDGDRVRLANGFVATSEVRRLPHKGSAEQMIADARKFIGTYYMWGGSSSWGIDCSGLAQLVHRLAGYTIPRDADLQFAAAKKVEPPYQPGDLLFFGGEPAVHAPRKITHVGLCLGGWKIIHSSRTNNGVYEDDVQAVEHLKRDFAGAGTFIR